MRENMRLNVGRLLCRNFREYLEGRKLSDSTLTYYEGKGWITRDFYIAGCRETLQSILADVAEWERAIKEAENA